MQDKFVMMLQVDVAAGDIEGPFFATLVIDRTTLELLMRRAWRLHGIRALDPGIMALVYHDCVPEFFQDVPLNEDEGPSEDARKIRSVFERKQYPAMCGFLNGHPICRVLEAGPDVPAKGNVRLSSCSMHVCYSGPPDGIYFFWEAELKQEGTVQIRLVWKNVDLMIVAHEIDPDEYPEFEDDDDDDLFNMDDFDDGIDPDDLPPGLN